MNAFVLYAIPLFLLALTFMLTRQIRGLFIKGSASSLPDLLAVPLTVVYMTMLISGSRMYWTFAGEDVLMKSYPAKQLPARDPSAHPARQAATRDQVNFHLSTQP